MISIQIRDSGYLIEKKLKKLNRVWYHVIIPFLGVPETDDIKDLKQKNLHIVENSRFLHLMFLFPFFGQVGIFKTNGDCLILKENDIAEIKT